MQGAAGNTDVASVAHLLEGYERVAVVPVRPIFFASSMKRDDGLPARGVR
jgi:hypothetical protein